VCCGCSKELQSNILCVVVVARNYNQIFRDFTPTISCWESTLL